MVSAPCVVAIVLGFVNCCTAEPQNQGCVDGECKDLSAAASAMLQVNSINKQVRKTGKIADGGEAGKGGKGTKRGDLEEGEECKGASDCISGICKDHACLAKDRMEGLQVNSMNKQVRKTGKIADGVEAGKGGKGTKRGDLEEGEECKGASDCISGICKDHACLAKDEMEAPSVGPVLSRRLGSRPAAGLMSSRRRGSRNRRSFGFVGLSQEPEEDDGAPTFENALAYDKDKDGLLSKEELFKLLENLIEPQDLKSASEFLQEHFSGVDKNGDGLDQKEFEELLSISEGADSCGAHSDCIDSEAPFCMHGTCAECVECHVCHDGVDGTCGSCGEGFPTKEAKCEARDSCGAHSDCIDSEAPFCYHGICAECEECHFCQDGVDGTCGSCGEGFPTEEAKCQAPSYED